MGTVKSNATMTQQEFDYSLACKKMLHNIEYLQLELDAAKAVGINGLSAGALRNVEARIYDLKAALYNALKTVGN